MKTHLSPREIEILQLVAKGLSNREVGAKLYLSKDTVKTHMQNITRKLGIQGRTAIVAHALREGLIR